MVVSDYSTHPGVQTLPVVGGVPQAVPLQLDGGPAIVTVTEDTVKHDHILYSPCHDACMQHIQHV